MRERRGVDTIEGFGVVGVVGRGGGSDKMRWGSGVMIEVSVDGTVDGWCVG